MTMSTTSCPTPRIVERGLVPPLNVGDEPCFTEAGLLALLGQMAYSVDETFNIEANLGAYSSFHRILKIAKAGSLQLDDYFLIRILFNDGVTPADKDPRGEKLANLCRQVVSAVDPGLILRIISEGTSGPN